MATHDFSTSLKYEQSKFPKADKFYTEKLGAKAITRVGFEDEESKALQRMDIDVAFTFQGRKIHVSEKDRTADYGDLLLEFYSMYPHKPGWMKNTHAEYMAYFVPGKVYWINKRQLTEFYNNVLAPVIPDEYFSQIVANNHQKSAKVTKQVKIGGVLETVTVVQAYNAPRYSSNEWYTLNICVKFDVLRRAGVDVTTYIL
jgi:hypothetical protein